MKYFIYALSINCFGLNSYAASLPKTIEGRSAINSARIKVSANSKSGLVVIFLSAKCPCSASHVTELAKLSQDFPNFQFAAIHSNTDEDKKETQNYFSSIQLPFPVVQDTNAKLADQFSAAKTPHAFVLGNDGTLLYKGGVSDSSDFKSSEQKYLRQALSEISAGQKVTHAETRALGCVISRGEKHVW